MLYIELVSNVVLLSTHRLVTEVDLKLLATSMIKLKLQLSDGQPGDHRLLNQIVVDKPFLQES